MLQSSPRPPRVRYADLSQVDPRLADGLHLAYRVLVVPLLALLLGALLVSAVLSEVLPGPLAAALWIR